MNDEHEAMQDPRNQLRKLLSSNFFRQLEAKLAPFNAFEAAGVVHQEERHSDFLAYLMRPREAHGLGERFLRAFLVGAIDEICETSDASPYHPLDIDLLD